MHVKISSAKWHPFHLSINVSIRVPYKLHHRIISISCWGQGGPTSLSQGHVCIYRYIRNTYAEYLYQGNANSMLGQWGTASFAPTGPYHYDTVVPLLLTWFNFNPSMDKYYNMTMWHFGPCVTFWPCLCDISARLVWHFGPLVRNEGKRVSPYPHINHWRRL